MPHPTLTDHSPHHPTPSSPHPNASNLLLIDNYDSFTWNIYQYLILEGARVTVLRNDECTLPDLIALNPTQLVVSPGPGHPDTDSGLSKEAIKHFSSKIPVLGVCMGEQCIFSVFGGRVDEAGEILHGKTSSLRHDGRGVYQHLDQALPVTRYHSLAGTHASLPDCLEVSSWIDAADGGVEVLDNSRGSNGIIGKGSMGVIMGVRHRELLVEGVQFHPESILTADGRKMLRNFLDMKGGTWEENKKLAGGVDIPVRLHTEANGVKAANGINGHTSSSKDKGSILERIFEHRQHCVSAQKQVPSQRPQDLQAYYDMDLAPPLISFRDRLRQSPFNLSLMAEIKRASPSKGLIAMSACAPAQARSHAMAGASVISVLTEPEWFKGSIDDLRAVRQSLEGMANRPAVLRKEFVFEEYQILEARLNGADTVLLIVKMLENAQLHRLYKYSRSLGMEPLVEVNTSEEMQIAAELQAQVIGVNNRNLATFDVDLGTTSRLMDAAPQGSIICALSGISGPKDVEPYRKNGVGAVLVGEALMRASNTARFVAELLGGGGSVQQQTQPRELLVKICGTRNPEAAEAAINAGADLIGMILVEGRKRFVPEDTAMAISEVVHSRLKDRQAFGRSKTYTKSAADFFSIAGSHHVTARHRALLVGVFQNQPLHYVLERQRMLDLDLVQLHGEEPIEWASLIPVPVIRSFKPDQPGISKRGYHALPLLDAGAGGSGQSLDSNEISHHLQKDPETKVLLAGGLGPDNVAERIQKLGLLRSQICGVDVSSGVEEDGVQSIEKIKKFITAAKDA